MKKRTIQSGTMCSPGDHKAMMYQLFSTEELFKSILALAQWVNRGKIYLEAPKLKKEDREYLTTTVNDLSQVMAKMFVALPKPLKEAINKELSNTFDMTITVEEIYIDGDSKKHGVFSGKEHAH